MKQLRDLQEKLYQTALECERVGLSIIPVNWRTKKPFSKWDAYQEERPTSDQIKEWFQGDVRAIACIGGKVSGGLLVIDFDIPRFFGPWKQAVGERMRGLVVQRTGGGGYQVMFRCPEPGSNAKLAWIPNDQEVQGREIAVETRAEGGYAIVAPSVHPSGNRYEWLQGGPGEILMLSQADADVLIEAARGLDEAPYTRQELQIQAKQREQAKTKAHKVDRPGESVIEAFNEANQIEDVLLQYGYVRRTADRFVRPGGRSDSVWIKDGRSFHHSTNDPLSDGYWHGAFDVFCFYEHDGEVKEAVKAAAEVLGLKFAPGIPPPSDAKAAPAISKPHRTDVGNGIRFADQHGNSANFVSEWGWMAYDDKRWQQDEREAERLAKLTARSILIEAAKEEDQDERKKLAKWAIQSENASRIKAMLLMARSEKDVQAKPEQFDVDPQVLNVQNGTLDLRTRELRPHRSKDLLTKIAGTKYDPDAECKLWESFLHRIMDGNYNLILFLQRALGYSLTGDTSEQCLFFCYGTGANGKTTLLETVQALLGDYGIQADMSTFLAKRFEGVNNDVARLNGARFVSAMEAGEGRRLAENVVKHMTGGDQVTARFLWREFFTYRPQFKLWLAANRKPGIRGTDYAIWRRIRLIPFRVTIPEDEQDHQLLDKLKEELPGILNWALDGCEDWRKDGLQTPKEVKAATEEYKSEMDILGQFIEECCVKSESENVLFSKLYERYNDWCIENNEHPMSKQKLGRRLVEEYGLRKDIIGANKRIYVGIGLREDF